MDEYFNILQRKIIEKENIEESKESKSKEGEEKKNRKITNEGIPIDWAKQKSRKKHVKVEFIES